MAKRREAPPDEGSPAWMTTFSDLMNLLLCFFVLLFASSTMDEGKIQKIAASFDNTTFSILDTSSVSLDIGDLVSGGVTQIPDIYSILSDAGKNVEGPTGDEAAASRTDAENLSDSEVQGEYMSRGEEQSSEMYDEIQQVAENYKIDDQIIMDFTSEYVELDMNGSLLFDAGEATVKDSSKLFLQKIASILIKYRHSTIEIEGHTDNMPTNSAVFDDNRQLSVERARSVYQYIIEQENFIESNIKISGYGESRPVASNATEEGRMRNRRVSIKIYNRQSSGN